MGTGEVLKVAIPMLSAAEAAAALGASLRLRLDNRPIEPEMAAALDGVLGALGVRDTVDALEPHEMAAVLGIVDGFLAQAADFAVEPTRKGWNHDQPSILLAQGNSSALVAGVLHRFVLPELGDVLARRLEEPDASFLDVGGGVAALSIAMCRLYPSLRAVSLDPWPPALALAHEQVAAAGLQERIEVREGIVEEVVHPGGFDVTWLPTFFIPRAALERGVEQVFSVTRPGGWATFGLYARPGDPFRDALADLRTVRQGGTLISPEDVAKLLEQAGFADVGVHYEEAWQLPVMYVAGRRP